MQTIETREEFEQMLELEKCLVFVAAEWSQPSKLAEAKLEQWNKSNAITVFKVDIDSELLERWVLGQQKMWH